jgi:hypothetical protein
MASLIMVAATLLGLAQIGLIATTGAALGSWACSVSRWLWVGWRSRCNGRLDVRAMPRVTAPARRRGYSPLPRELPVRRPVDPAPWTPVPLPQPLYLSKPPVQRTTPAVDAGTLLRQAAAQARRRSAPLVPPRPSSSCGPTRPPPAWPTATPGMGILDPADTAVTDLDEVLRRRRSAG